MSIYDQKPDPFLEKRSECEADKHKCIVVCAGYESGVWRHDQLARHLIMGWLVEFSLRFSEINGKSAINFAEMLNRAVQYVYNTEKYENRGEIGEILLHAVCRQFYNSLPVVAKFFFKDSPNDTVKGYDAVHIVENEGRLELWLGEVKFYKRANDAVRDVIAEIKEHTTTEFLRKEFMAVSPKIDPNMPHYAEIKRLLHVNTSLDEVFDKLVIPIFISYESPIVRSSDKICEDFIDGIKSEADAIFDKFSGSFEEIEIRIFLLPMNRKDNLVNSFDARLKKLQEGMQ